MGGPEVKRFIDSGFGKGPEINRFVERRARNKVKSTDQAARIMQGQSEILKERIDTPGFLPPRVLRALLRTAQFVGRTMELQTQKLQNGNNTPTRRR